MLAAIIIDDAGDGHGEAGHMRAAVRRMDIVDKRQDILGVRVVILHGDFHARGIHKAAHVNRLLDQRRLVLVDVLDELADTTLVIEHALTRFHAALILEYDADAAIEERHLTEANLERIKAEVPGFKDAFLIAALDVRPEADDGAGTLRFTHDLEVIADLAALVLLLMDLAILIDGDHQMLGERIDDRRADAVQTAGDLVSAAAEFAARMQNRQADLDRRTAQLGMQADREAASIIRHRAGAILMQRDDDLRAITGQGLVDSIIDYLIDQVMQAALIGGADIHARTLANSLQALEHLNLVLVIGLGDLLRFLKGLQIHIFFDLGEILAIIHSISPSLPLRRRRMHAQPDMLPARSPPYRVSHARAASGSPWKSARDTRADSR